MKKETLYVNAKIHKQIIMKLSGKRGGWIIMDSSYYKHDSNNRIVMKEHLNTFETVDENVGKK